MDVQNNSEIINLIITILKEKRMQATELHSLLDVANQLFEAKKYNQSIRILLIIKKKKSYGYAPEFGEMIDDMICDANNRALEDKK